MRNAGSMMDSLFILFVHLKKAYDSIIIIVVCVGEIWGATNNVGDHQILSRYHVRKCQSG